MFTFVNSFNGLRTIRFTRVHVYIYISNPSPWEQIFQPLILGQQRGIGGHYIVNGERHDLKLLPEIKRTELQLPHTCI